MQHVAASFWRAFAGSKIAVCTERCAQKYMLIAVQINKEEFIPCGVVLAFS